MPECFLSPLKNLHELKGKTLGCWCSPLPCHGDILSQLIIDLWFLLHYKNQTANISTDDCIRELCNRNNNNYKKGVINKKLKDKLNEKYTNACKRAKQKELFKNPSTNIYELIQILEVTKND